MAAEALLGDAAIPPRQAATLAQQAAEKAIKATFVFAGREPERTHDLVALVGRADAGLGDRLAAIDLGQLSSAHRAARYPSYFDPPIGRAETGALVADARAVVEAVTERLRDMGLEPPAPE
jgi:HEPN domain-containing protein